MITCACCWLDTSLAVAFNDILHFNSHLHFQQPGRLLGILHRAGFFDAIFGLGKSFLQSRLHHCEKTLAWSMIKYGLPTLES